MNRKAVLKWVGATVTLSTLSNVFRKVGVYTLTVASTDAVYNSLLDSMSTWEPLFVTESSFKRPFSTGRHSETDSYMVEYPVEGFYSIPLETGNIFAFVKVPSAHDDNDALVSSKPMSSRRDVALVIRILRTDRRRLHRYLSSAAEYYFGEKHELRVWGWDSEYGGVQSMGPLFVPPFKKELMPLGVQDLFDDLDEFIAAKDWYAERYRKYKRVYLLHGPPGTGKTTLAQQLAKHVRKDIYFVPLAAVLSDPQKVGNLARNQDAVILIEDIHALTSITAEEIHRAKVRNVAPGATLPKEVPEKNYSGLLNFLDGSMTYNDQIVVMTANRIDHLPEELVRDSRVDLTLKVGDLDSEMIKYNFEKFYEQEFTLDFEASCSMGTLQNAFLRYKEDPVAAKKLLGL